MQVIFLINAAYNFNVNSFLTISLQKSLTSKPKLLLKIQLYRILVHENLIMTNLLILTNETIKQPSHTDQLLTRLCISEYFFFSSAINSTLNHRLFYKENEISFLKCLKNNNNIFKNNYFFFN